MHAAASRAAAGRSRRRHARLLLLLLLAAASMLGGGCHDRERLRERLEGPPARLPVEPDQPDTLPAPALLDTIRPWMPPPSQPVAATNQWPTLISLEATDDVELTYRVPGTWEDRGGGESRSRSRDVEAQLRLTQLDDSDISLATYAAQLADGSPIYQYATTTGHIVYLTRREVALAPSDPAAPREVFHTAVTSVDGSIAKLDVRYDSELDWRYDERAAAISATLQVRRTDA